MIYLMIVDIMPQLSLNMWMSTVRLGSVTGKSNHQVRVCVIGYGIKW